MDTLDTRLKDFFTPAAPARLARRVLRRVDEPGPDLSGLIARFAIEASDRGVRRLAYGRGRDVATRAGRRHVERAREELHEYLGGRRTFFTVPVDLEVPPFQAKVLAAADRVPFGAVASYAELAQRIGHPRAARATRCRSSCPATGSCAATGRGATMPSAARSRPGCWRWSGPPPRSWARPPPASSAGTAVLTSSGSPRRTGSSSHPWPTPPASAIVPAAGAGRWRDGMVVSRP